MYHGGRLFSVLFTIQMTLNTYMSQWLVRLAARSQSTQPNSHSNLLIFSDEVNEGGDLYGVTDDDHL